MCRRPFQLRTYRSPYRQVSFERWLFCALRPPQRRATVCALGEMLPRWGPDICRTHLGRRHGPALVEVRLRIAARHPAPIAREPRPTFVTIHVFFHVLGRSLLLLSGGISPEPRLTRWRSVPGLGDARWLTRDVAREHHGAEGTARGTLHATLGADRIEPIKDHPSTTLYPDTGVAETRPPTCGSWQTNVYDRVIAEARAEGKHALADLRRHQDGYRLASVLVAGRLAAGLTQRELAAASGVRQSELSPIEAGHGNPTLSTLGALARALDVELRIGRQPDKV